MQAVRIGEEKNLQGRMPKKGQKVQLVVLLQSAWFLKVRYAQSVLQQAMGICCGFARQCMQDKSCGSCL